jgi:alanyl-tRNA synthetase
METKLFYQDAYINNFSTSIFKQTQDEKGNWYAVLNQTAFYPTGGGQPFDTGTLNGMEVMNVIEIDGEIRHYLKKPFDEETSMVEGQINWERRFDHMQQHSGQHILSAAFEELKHYRTLSFHLGQEFLTIDIDVENLESQEVELVEKRANQIIIENRPIFSKWVTEEELAQYPLRKEPTVSENIRLVMIPEFDYNGCGGTHPRATGEVRAIKILNWERQKKKTRVYFVCGDRVLEQLHKKNIITTKLKQILNTPENNLVNALEHQFNHYKTIEKQVEELNLALLQYEALEMIEHPLFINENLVISKFDLNRSLKELQQLARIVASLEKGAIVLLISEYNSQLQLVVARGEASNLSMKDLIIEILPYFNGKGGGNESMAQGGGDPLVSREELLQISLEKMKMLKLGLNK